MMNDTVVFVQEHPLEYSGCVTSRLLACQPFVSDHQWHPVHVLSLVGSMEALEDLFQRARDSNASPRMLLEARTKSLNGEETCRERLSWWHVGLRGSRVMLAETCLHKAARAGNGDIIQYLLWCVLNMFVTAKAPYTSHPAGPNPCRPSHGTFLIGNPRAGPAPTRWTATSTTRPPSS
jgi:hypothetical protein